MAIKMVTTANCDVTGKEHEATHLFRLRVTPLHTMKQIAPGSKVDGAFPSISGEVTVIRKGLTPDGGMVDWEDLGYETLTETHEVYMLVVPKGSKVNAELPVNEPATLVNVLTEAGAGGENPDAGAGAEPGAAEPGAEPGATGAGATTGRAGRAPR